MRIYIAGPISGIDDDNRRAFARAEDFLLQAGHEPINPHKVCEPTDDYDTCMKKDLKALGTCQGIYLLLGWEDSPGALVELEKARELGLEVGYEH
jgi:hypothetical protein